MIDFQLAQSPHRRFNPLTREWVLVSPQRTDRPWQGQLEEVTSELLRPYDPDCYLCPGNSRANGKSNPQYSNTFVFDNDFAALRPETTEAGIDRGGLIVAEPEKGICRVVCFSPRHDLTIGRMSTEEITRVVETWITQQRELGALPFIKWVQIFENRGTLMGASNTHPHGQIWANQSVPNEAAKESFSQNEYYLANQSCLLCDYLRLELDSNQRVVLDNDDFCALIPFWAVWPFEILIVSKRHLAALDELSSSESISLADILKRMTTGYDKLFQAPFPYTMGIHGQPTDGKTYPGWHLHLHFYPPLLRSATIRKFMVGYEMLCMPQRDITAETAAQRLRDVSDKNQMVKVLELQS